ncbi:hypothetical protein TrVE_jg6095 [Triparma verrucosa]|uniref:Uncharacterized protein n=2 Tax=Triparma TaxID=722752 RepID=A0A9W7A730_9STRA|nr:hypothetical protein TrST_g12377 [Triparma strigata]GMH99911.1 hypothetical protein TrVE_jg6095 [Triparma verrucosa]
MNLKSFFVFLALAPVVCAYNPSPRSVTKHANVKTAKSTASSSSDRRSLLLGLATVIAGVSSPWEARAGEMRGDVALTPLNSLAFQYRGSDNPGAPKPLDEPSIDYADFITLLNDGYVKFVEFLAPNGDKAYATIVLASKDDKDKKDAETMRIRIGRGYPTEDPEGWSSPSFVIRTVKEKNVPYKFFVPELTKFQLSQQP